MNGNAGVCARFRPSVCLYLVLFLFLFLFLFCIVPLAGQQVAYKGLVTAWANTRLQKPLDPQLGIRFIPEFSLAQNISESWSLDGEFSFNAFGTVQFRSENDTFTDSRLKPYRLWARISGSQFEARMGLQKINFGPAMLLRSLMWFDSIDPRDPLQLTDGVYGLLLRYYFVNNANLWLWGLYGNQDPKGLEVVPTQKGSLEWGGRAQVPVGQGEAAFTYHHRRIDLENRPYLLFSPGELEAPENRFALDGKWDLGIGLWFEAAVTQKHHDTLIYPWTSALTLGMDYTFDVGNGLQVLAEHFIYQSGEKAFGSKEGLDFSGLFLNYPLNILDTANLMFFTNWDNHDLYSFLNLRRTYDRWSFNFMGFWNPPRFEIYPDRSGGSQFTGKGFQIMVVFNY